MAAADCRVHGTYDRILTEITIEGDAETSCDTQGSSGPCRQSPLRVLSSSVDTVSMLLAKTLALWKMCFHVSLMLSHVFWRSLCGQTPLPPKTSFLARSSVAFSVYLFWRAASGAGLYMVLHLCSNHLDTWCCDIRSASHTEGRSNARVSMLAALECPPGCQLIAERVCVTARWSPSINRCDLVSIPGRCLFQL